MKKHQVLLAILIISFILPNISLASWWNPFSWFDRPIKTEVKPLENPTDFSKYLATTTASTTSKSTKNFEKKEDKPTTVVNTSYIPTVQNIQPANTTLCNGIYYTNCLSGTNLICPNTGKAYCQSPKTDNQKCQDSFGSNSIYSGEKNSSGGLICSCKTGYKWNSSGTSCEQSILDQYLQTIKEEQDQVEQEDEDRRNSPECLEAKEAYDDINSKIKKTEESMKKYDTSSEKYRELLSKAADLTVESMPISSEYYSACEDFVPTPPKTYNTNCYWLGDTVRCTTR